MTADFAASYGPWALVAGASDGTGAAFAADLARRGLNVLLIARRKPLLDELARSLPVETRVIELDLSTEDAARVLADATDDLEIGLVAYNAGGDTNSLPFLEQPVDDLRAILRRNCNTVLDVCHHFGGRMVERRRGGLVLVSSGAAWGGAKFVATYGATKAFNSVLAEALWIEWRDQGVDVLSLVLGATDTPAIHRLLDRHGGDMGPMADPVEVARETFDHLGDGPTWNYGMPDPQGPSPFGTMNRRDVVELMSQGTAAMFGSS